MLTCPILNIPVFPNNCHIDHVPPKTFKQLVKNWLITENIKIKDVKFDELKDDQIVRKMTDKTQKRSWQMFHQENAILRVLSVKANLSQKHPKIIFD